MSRKSSSCLQDRVPQSMPNRNTSRNSWGLLRTFTFLDGLLVFLGVTAAILNGALIPSFSVIFGNLIDVVGNGGSNFSTAANKYVSYLLYLAIAAMCGGYVEIVSFSTAARRQTRVLKNGYVKEILNMDQAWFDANEAQSKIVKVLNEDGLCYHNAIGERLGGVIRNLTTCIAGLIVAFYRGWEMAFVLSATIPLLIGVGGIISLLHARIKAKLVSERNKPESIAIESLTNIRTVASYALQEQLIQKYSTSLVTDRKIGIYGGFFSGMINGATFGIFSFSYALAIWFGSIKVSNNQYTGGQVVNVLFAGVMAGYSLGQAIPNVKHIIAAKSAYLNLVSLRHNLESETQSSRSKLEDLQGDIEFDHVTFSYPTRKDRPVLRDFNLVIPAGTCVALIGDSGSGKSTVIQLLERFYQPNKGRIFVDGDDLANLDIDWWRSQVSFVSQEPVIFHGTIFENVSVSKPEATMEEVIKATTAAHAHEFVTKLPQGYSTVVGSNGAQLSGGQRQRIAIARAFLQNPKVVLLDEATSALDNQSERVVQDSMENLLVGKTCIMIAHRLSTILKADSIVVVRNGQATEHGTHNELLKSSIFYSSLISKQLQSEGENDNDCDESNPMPVITKKQITLRDSILKRMSVRLSVIPAQILKKLREGKKEQTPSGEENKKFESSLSRLCRLSIQDWKYSLLGFSSSLVLGLQMPAFALALSGIVGTFYETTSSQIIHGGQKWAVVYTTLGCAAAISGILQSYSFGYVAQGLGINLRIMFLKSALFQEMQWHDAPENTPGKLLAKLANDCTLVQNAVADDFGLLFQNVATLIATAALALSASWSLTAIVFSMFLPLMTALWVHSSMSKRLVVQAQEATEHATQIAIDGVQNIKTVKAYRLQKKVAGSYEQETKNRSSQKSEHIIGIAYGIAQFVLYAIVALSFWYGTKEVAARKMSFQQLMKGFSAIFFGTFSMVSAYSKLPDVNYAISGAKWLFDIIDLFDDTDPTKKNDVRLPLVEGDVEFSDITFAYPSRPGRLVFKHFSLRIPAGTSCALVGESGHGKSTVVNLIQKFYDVTDGKVLLDNVNIQSLDTQWLRSITGLVGQDPVLFNGTILENILYGNPEATIQDVAEALKVSNAFDFVEKLPEKYETSIGNQGVQLSGGQKQRIAIARAFLRKPKILILDEATSALDAETEASVQQTLQNFMNGRTTIIIAHRLNTVKSATKIAAVYRGRVLEEGSHEELLSLNRYYAYLVKLSQL